MVKHQLSFDSIHRTGYIGKIIQVTKFNCLQANTLTHSYKLI